MTRPNFLVIMTDQHRADHLGCYGNPTVKTPNIDNLARHGTQFENFYVATPICMPNRIAMMTGRTPGTNGSRHNGIPLDLDAVTFVDVLRGADYRTALIGKSHLQDMTDRKVQSDPWSGPDGLVPPPPALADASRARRVGPGYESELMPLWKQDPDREIPLPHYGFDHVRFANGHGDKVHGHYDAWLRDRHPSPYDLRGSDAALAAPDNKAPQSWRTAVPEDLYPTSFVRDETISFLKDHAAAHDGEPFFLQCSFPDPHHPFTPPGKYWDMYNPDDIPLPRTFHTVGENEHPFLTRLRNQASLGDSDDSGPRPFVLEDEDAIRQAIALTYGMITMVDDAVGDILETLKQSGLSENTIVIFTSDHGDFMGDHGLMLKHGLHYCGVLQVPFIWSDPKSPGACVTNELACSIDLGATVLARAGLAPPNGFQGLDVISGTTPQKLAARRGIIVEEDELGDHLGTDDPIRTRTFIDGNWRLTLYDGTEHSELFDLANDPLEIRNLWADEDYRIKRAELVEAMLREMIRLSDTAPRSVHVA